MTDGKSRAGIAPDEQSLEFYRRVLDALTLREIPFLVGGAYAFRSYTGIDRCTRDFDVFLKREDAFRALDLLKEDGFSAEMVFEHWLAKIYSDSDYVDLIFSSGNGVAVVDDTWFERAVPGDVLDRAVKLIPIEEMIWSKGYIMERERFDGSDILHLIHAVHAQIDWDHLRARFEPHGRVLLAHLLLFGFVYPSERHLVPESLMRSLFESAIVGEEWKNGAVCRGTLLSRSQYLPDLDRGYRDARLKPLGTMSAEEIGVWTEAADVPPPHG
jgi:hypothetical protein